MAAILIPVSYRVQLDRPVDREQLVSGPVPTLPGVNVDRWSNIHVPENAWSILRGQLETAEIPYSVTRKGPERLFTWDEILNRQELTAEAIAFLEDTPYQKRVLEYTCNRPGTLLSSPAGSGKSLMGLAWCLAAPGPAIYVTKAGARLTMLDEMRRYLAKGVKYCMLEGLTPGPIDSDCRIYLIAAETLAAWEETLLGIRPMSIVFDESHKLQNRKRFTRIFLNEDDATAIERGYRRLSRGEFMKREDPPVGSEPGTLGQAILFQPLKTRAASASRLARFASRRLVMSATPIPDRVRNLWAQLDLAEPKAWGASTLWLFRHAGARAGAFGGLDTLGETNQSELKERMRTTQFVVPFEEANRDLPPLRRTVRRIKPEDLDRVNEEEFRKAMKACRSIQEKREVAFFRAASMKRSYVLSKLEELIAAKQKVLVFTGRRKDADKLGEWITKKYGDALGANLWIGHGEHTDVARMDMRNAYMAAVGPAVLVGTMHAWGESYNLQDTDALIMAMLPYEPYLVQQSEGRVRRKGMNRPAIVYYLIAEGTVDETVAARLLEKLPAIEKLTDDTGARAILESLRGTAEEILADIREKIEGSLADEEELEAIAAKAAANASTAVGDSGEGEDSS